jgi:hypothetical protein
MISKKKKKSEINKIKFFQIKRKKEAVQNKNIHFHIYFNLQIYNNNFYIEIRIFTLI